ncbi:MAG: hypothetical protein ACC642_03440 [Pseudomonadales bacterium]
MKTTVVTLTGLLLSCSTGALANPTRCEYGELSRIIEVVYSDPGQPLPCEVIYNKSEEGSIESLWRADNEVNYCEDRVVGLIEKLEGLGWTCANTTQDPQSLR